MVSTAGMNTSVDQRLGSQHPSTLCRSRAVCYADAMPLRRCDATSCLTRGLTKKFRKLLL